MSQLKSLKEIRQLRPPQRYEYLADNETGLSEIYDTDTINPLFASCFDCVVYFEDKAPKFKAELLARLGTEESLTKKKNFTWAINHTRIINYIDTFVKKSARMPTIIEVSIELGISRQTIAKHLDTLKDSEYSKVNRDILGVARQGLMEQLLKKGLTGDLKAANLFLKYTHKQIEQQQPVQQQFIQVNNIYITPEAVQALPEAKKKELETIFLSEALKLKLPK